MGTLYLANVIVGFVFVLRIGLGGLIFGSRGSADVNSPSPDGDGAEDQRLNDLLKSSPTVGPTFFSKRDSAMSCCSFLS